MPPPAPHVSVIIVSYKGAGVIRGCLDTLLASDYHDYEVIVVDNGSTDGTGEIVREHYPSVRIVRLARNMGYAGGLNEGLRVARGEVLLPLNDDTEVDSGMIGALLEPLARDPRVGIVGCKILYPDRRTLQHAGARILANACTLHIGQGEEDRGQYDSPGEMDYVTGCAQAIRRTLFEELGLYDDRYFPAYYEEIEFAVRARRRGWKIVYQPRARLFHLESNTAGLFSDAFFFFNHRSRWRFILKNYGLAQAPAVLRAELRYWWHMGHKRREGRILLRAYLYVLARLPQILWDRRHRVLPLPPRV